MRTLPPWLGRLLSFAEPIQASVLPPPQALALADYDPLVRPGALEEAYTMLDQLRIDLQGADRRMEWAHGADLGVAPG